VTLYLGERSKDGVINTTELAKHGLKAHSSFRESATELQLISRVPPWMDALMADLKKGVMLLTRGSKSGFCWPKSGRLPLMHAVLGVGSWFREMSTGDQALLTERFLNVVRDYMNTQLLDSLNVPTTKMVAKIVYEEDEANWIHHAITYAMGNTDEPVRGGSDDNSTNAIKHLCVMYAGQTSMMLSVPDASVPDDPLSNKSWSVVCPLSECEEVLSRNGKDALDGLVDSKLEQSALDDHFATDMLKGLTQVTHVAVLGSFYYLAPEFTKLEDPYAYKWVSLKDVWEALETTVKGQGRDRANAVRFMRFVHYNFPDCFHSNDTIKADKGDLQMVFARDWSVKVTHDGKGGAHTATITEWTKKSELSDKYGTPPSGFRTTWASGWFIEQMETE